MQHTHRNSVLIRSITGVVLVGAGSRIFHSGFWIIDKYLGDALYAVLFYLLLSLFWKQGKPLAKAGIITIFVLAVETFQLTGIPLQLWLSGNITLKLLSIVLGTHFSWWDVVAYLVGIAGVYLLDSLYGSRQMTSAP